MMLNLKQIRPGLLSLLVWAVAIANCCAQGEAPAGPASWELTPYRVEIRVVVEPSARLPLGLSAELQQELVALAQANLGGPWIVVPAAQPVGNSGKLLRQLANLDESPPLGAIQDVDKVLVIAVQEIQGELKVIAREWDVALQVWNTPVERTAVQVSRLPTVAFAALHAAWGPVLRIDAVDNDTVTVTLQAGSLPRRDGSLLAIDRSLPFAVFLLPTDKAGQPVKDEIKLVPWTYLTPLSLPGSSTPSGTSRASFKCRLHTALAGSPIPEFHPLLQRLAIGKPQSGAASRLLLVDQEEPNDPLEGYEVYLAPIEATSATVKPQKVGVTGRSGEVKLPAGDGSLSRLIVMHGGEELTRRPYLPGLRSEVRLRLPSNRQRLELAAEVTAAEDEFLEEIGRLTILGLRLQDSLTKRDLTGAPRIAQELKATAELAPLMNRLGTLEAKINSADEATKSRFGPLIARLKAEADTLKSTIGKLP